MLPDRLLKDELDCSKVLEAEIDLPRRNFHVLIVDDDEGVRAVLSFALLLEGYQVTTASDGLTALKMVREKEPDFIILDLILPKIEGLEVCWRIREFSDVPIMIVSAQDRDAEKVWGLKAGADDYMTKPFSDREVIARIEAIQRRRKKSRSLP